VLYRQQIWEKRNVQFIFYGGVLIRRHGEPRPAVTARVQMGQGFVPQDMDWLLDWQSETSDPRECEKLLDSRPVVSPHAELAVFHRVRDRRFVAEAFSLRSNQPFDAECIIKPWLAQIVSQCDGRKSWREHFDVAHRAGLVDAAATPGEFLAALAPLVMNGLLWVDARPLRGDG